MTNEAVLQVGISSHYARVTDEHYFAVVRMRIREARKAIGYTQEYIADKIGLDLRHYQRYEGRVTPDSSMSLSTLRKIARVLECRLCSLIDEPKTSEIKNLSGDG